MHDDMNIDASITQAENLLSRLNLKSEEEAWAKREAKTVFKETTERFLVAQEEGLPHRALVVTAALAYAMTITRDWAAAVDEMARKASRPDEQK